MVHGSIPSAVNDAIAGSHREFTARMIIVVQKRGRSKLPTDFYVVARICANGLRGSKDMRSDVSRLFKRRAHDDSDQPTSAISL